MHSIRLATPNDAAAVADVYRPAVLDAATTFEDIPPDAAEFARRIEKVLQRTPWLVWEEGNAILGYAYASPHRERSAYRWTVETSVYVAPGQQRRGIARGLYLNLFQRLTEQGFVNALAGVLLPNPGSVALHESLGFARVGIYPGVGYKRGVWYDTAWYSRDLAPRRVPMGEVGWGARIADAERHRDEPQAPHPAV